MQKKQNLHIHTIQPEHTNVEDIFDHLQHSHADFFQTLTLISADVSVGAFTFYTTEENPHTVLHAIAQYFYGITAQFTDKVGRVHAHIQL